MTDMPNVLWAVPTHEAVTIPFPAMEDVQTVPLKYQPQRGYLGHRHLCAGFRPFGFCDDLSAAATTQRVTLNRQAFACQPSPAQLDHL